MDRNLLEKQHWQINLPKHFNTVWIPEFARDYLQEKWDKTKQICQQDDMLPIAIGQTKLKMKDYKGK